MSTARFFGYAVGIIWHWPNVDGVHIETVQDGWQISASYGQDMASIVIKETELAASGNWWQLIEPLGKEVHETQGLSYE